MDWTASPDPLAFGYLVYRDGGGQTGRLISWQGTATSYTDATVAPGTDYRYYVRSWDLTGRTQHRRRAGRRDDALSAGGEGGLREAPACHLTTTDRETGRLRIVELPFGLRGRRLYALAAPGPLADWVRDVLREPAVSVRIGEVALRGDAVVLDPGAEVERARALLLAKYDAGASEDLSYWIRSGQPVRVDLRSGPARRGAR